MNPLRSPHSGAKVAGWFLRPVLPKARAPVCAARTLNAAGSGPVHAIDADKELKSSLSATAGGKAAEICPNNDSPQAQSSAGMVSGVRVTATVAGSNTVRLVNPWGAADRPKVTCSPGPSSPTVTLSAAGSVRLLPKKPCRTRVGDKERHNEHRAPTQDPSTKNRRLCVGAADGAAGVGHVGWAGMHGPVHWRVHCVTVRAIIKCNI